MPELWYGTFITYLEGEKVNLSQPTNIYLVTLNKLKHLLCKMSVNEFLLSHLLVPGPGQINLNFIKVFLPHV